MKRALVRAKVFLADLDDYQAMNAVYAEFLGEDPPARAAVQVARIPRDARVEIMVLTGSPAQSNQPGVSSQSSRGHDEVPSTRRKPPIR